MYTAKNFERLLGTAGMSDTLLKNHFTLYEGYVKNTNAALERLEALAKEGKRGTSEYAELKRRFGWEWNGMKLHELYFGNMKKGGSVFGAESALGKKIAAQWGSFEEWAKGFKATGTMRGIGWVILAHDKEADRLFNIWVNEHDVGHLAGATPLLVMDVFEHAFMLDYGLKRADYIEAFWKAVDWEVAAGRL
ncbi:MAG: superoxide dismutase [Candidatus Lloydbacteria bacterium RIFCSPHIGHO2_02_FULL_54_17]|uniref:superoxide dismutase n=1 Tax=Candidatus Lloydbacteria bacterium RIFCSPHIGHO2_02_FULL_54_17 TaxID=1798664 RepID=A0A1G2DB44_9BACT|nr:MAG: superoxide dismutase [Candidatus Lloydbacteria bacterium RIFCSPHIGHO2_02_FULL_54_17]OGZ13064.1 MAG: superoxide dismutase [Candidatus Lloydbacteria bacterium RIFCSPLOWO2_01_FULL_54_18]OGZ16512.1 MAG: superoxide dismutase [Candidatus Lloydbacteria bacterium RIFCSPLOWO2_02_FULL_54_12]